MADTRAQQPEATIEAVFRGNRGTVTAALVRLFGPENLDLVETAQQDAMLRALEAWRQRGVPDNPTAWLIKAARNLAIDQLRRRRMQASHQGELGSEAALSEPDWDDQVTLRSELADDQLRMMFVCCHPSLSQEAQVALTLKTLCGMQVEEIARALLTPTETIAKRLTRAKRKLREERISFVLPGSEAFAGRLDTVLMVLYLLFSEGYRAHKGAQLIRRELCEEATRLVTLLSEHPLTGLPQTHALRALMLLHGARLAGRQTGDGETLTLAEQDRGRWDKKAIRRGLASLARSADGDAVTAFHLEAGIAACHAVAPDYEATDWGRIVELYDSLVLVATSPIVALNRAIAIGMYRGAAAGLSALDAIVDHPALSGYFLLPAARGEMLARLEAYTEAAACLRDAQTLAATEPDRRFIAKRLREIEAL